MINQVLHMGKQNRPLTILFIHVFLCRSFDLASSPEFSPVHCGGASPMTPVPTIASSKSELEEGRYYSDAFISPNPPAGAPQMLSPRGMQQLSDELQLRLSFNEGRNRPSSVSGADSSAGAQIPSLSPTSPPCDPLIRALLDLIIVMLEGLYSLHNVTTRTFKLLIHSDDVYCITII